MSNKKIRKDHPRIRSKGRSVVKGASGIAVTLSTLIFDATAQDSTLVIEDIDADAEYVILDLSEDIASDDVDTGYFYVEMPEKQNQGYVSVDVPFGSWHARDPAPGHEYTEFNPGLGLSYTKPLNDRFGGSWTTSAAIFKDSYSLTSGIISTTYSIPVPEMEFVHVGGTLAVAYKGIDFNQPQTLIAAPLLHVTVDLTDNLSISAEGIPFKVGNYLDTPFLGFEANYKLDNKPPP